MGATSPAYPTGPPSCGFVAESLANTNAKQIAQNDAMIQLTKVIEPIAARFDGSNAIPEPIILAATIAEHANKPRFFLAITDPHKITILN